MLQGTHHHPHKKPITGLDHVMYAVALLSPFVTVPQVIDIWTNKDASGLSVFTWGAYTLISFMWILYWREHQEKWILVSQILIVILNAGVLLGILVYS
jgi:uncharacterized protein with PQ loop repeat